jgi:hypothetical protein
MGLGHSPVASGLLRARCTRTNKNEAELRAAVHRAARRSRRIDELFVPPVGLGDTASDMTTEGYHAVMSAWPYHYDLDQVIQVIEAPDGTLVAFALGWLDEVNRVGELEPVGTDPRHARKGPGSAVSVVSLQALRGASATQAVVYPRGDSAHPVACKV